MVKAPPVPSSLTDTFLVSGGASLEFFLLPVELSGTSSTVAQHSEEVRLPEHNGVTTTALYVEGHAAL